MEVRLTPKFAKVYDLRGARPASKKMLPWMELRKGCFYGKINQEKRVSPCNFLTRKKLLVYGLPLGSKLMTGVSFFAAFSLMAFSLLISIPYASIWALSGKAFRTSFGNALFRFPRP